MGWFIRLKEGPKLMFSKKNVPNILTFIRIGLAPIIVFTFFISDSNTILGLSVLQARIIAVLLMIIAELSDAADGFAARKLGVVSDFGKLFDPFADSVYRFSVFAAFAVIGYMPIWMLLIFFYRDSLTSFLRVLSGLKGVAMGARISGKIKAWVQAVAMFAVMLVDMYRLYIGSNEIIFSSVIFIAMLCASLYTLYSGVDYLLGALPLLKVKSQNE